MVWEQGGGGDLNHFNVLFLYFFVHYSIFSLFTFHNRSFLMNMHPLSPADLSQFSTAVSDTVSCQEELSFSENFGAVFLLLMSIIKCLSSAAVVIFSALALFCQFLTAFEMNIVPMFRNQILGNLSLRVTFFE